MPIKRIVKRVVKRATRATQKARKATRRATKSVKLKAHIKARRIQNKIKGIRTQITSPKIEERLIKRQRPKNRLKFLERQLLSQENKKVKDPELLSLYIRTQTNQLFNNDTASQVIRMIKNNPTFTAAEKRIKVKEYKDLVKGVKKYLTDEI